MDCTRAFLSLYTGADPETADGANAPLIFIATVQITEDGAENGPLGSISQEDVYKRQLVYSVVGVHGNGKARRTEERSSKVQDGWGS